MIFPDTLIEQDCNSAELLKYIDKRLAKVSKSDDLTFIHTLGFPGSGKTTIVRQISKNMPETELVIFDEAMQPMEAYKDEPDKEKAFNQCEVPARMAGYSLIEKLIEKKANILFEHSDSRVDHVELLKFAKSLGYKIIIVDIITDKEIAKNRLVKRYKKDGRFTPAHYVDEGDTVIRNLKPSYKQIADKWVEVVNDGSISDLRRLTLI